MSCRTKMEQKRWKWNKNGSKVEQKETRVCRTKMEEKEKRIECESFRSVIKSSCKMWDIKTYDPFFFFERGKKRFVQSPFFESSTKKLSAAKESESQNVPFQDLTDVQKEL
jgi:hypothetical protein